MFGVANVADPRLPVSANFQLNSPGMSSASSLAPFFSIFCAFHSTFSSFSNISTHFIVCSTSYEYLFFVFRFFRIRTCLLVLLAWRFTARRPARFSATASTTSRVTRTGTLSSTARSRSGDLATFSGRLETVSKLCFRRFSLVFSSNYSI